MEGNNGGKEKKRSKVSPRIFLAIIFLLGLAIFLYPVISNAINARSQSYVVEKYKEDTDKISNENLEKIKADARKYNEILKGGAAISDPFSEGATQVIGSGYTDLLDVGETMGYLEIPKINVNLPIYHGTSDQVLQKGVGHIENTSLPIGGASTHAVLTGHRGLPSSILFRYLNELVVGDVFYIHVLDEVHAYKVKETVIVIPTDIERIKIVNGEDLVTLITCDPYMLNYNRLLVQGERIPYVAENVETEVETNVQAVESKPSVETEINNRNNETGSLQKLMIMTPALIIIGVLGYIIFKKRRTDRLSGDKK
ncbi:MAG: class C sortase [Clostridiaceae bacterium]